VKIIVKYTDKRIEPFLLSRGGKILKEGFVELSPEETVGTIFKPDEVEIVFDINYPLKETRDGRNIRGELDPRREHLSEEYWRDEEGRLRYTWQSCAWQRGPATLGAIVEKAIKERPLTEEEAKKKAEEEEKKKREEEEARKREERARKRANLKEWKRSLRSYLADLEKEVSRVKDLLKPRRSYTYVRDGFYEPRLRWDSEDDDC